jgi:hypothetical protein
VRQVQTQYKNLFSEEGLAKMQRRFKEEQRAGGDDGPRGSKQYEVHVPQTNKEAARDNTLKFYGDQVTFEYLQMFDTAQKKRVVDARFQAQAMVRNRIHLHVWPIVPS